MKNRYLIIVCALFSPNFMSGQGDDVSHSHELELSNGLYLIKAEYTSHPVPPPESPVIVYSHEFLDPDESGEPLYLEIDTSEFVHFDLAREPEGIEQPDQRINLMLTLNNTASEQLADFTKKHLNKHVAIVIGNKAVTKHKVRTRIDGGKLQITRCTDNACEQLLLELRENYRN